MQTPKRSVNAKGLGNISCAKFNPVYRFLQSLEMMPLFSSVVIGPPALLPAAKYGITTVLQCEAGARHPRDSSHLKIGN